MFNIIFVLIGIVAFACANWDLSALTAKAKEKVAPHYSSMISTPDIEKMINDFGLASASMMPQFSSSLPMDIHEEGDKIEVLMDIPGVDKKDITIKLHKNNELVVSVHKTKALVSEGKNYKRQERFSGDATRTIYFPEYASMDKLEADYTNGVLKLVVPKETHFIEDIAKMIQIK
jgi:HSP20 family protein